MSLSTSSLAQGLALNNQTDQQIMQMLPPQYQQAVQSGQMTLQQAEQAITQSNQQGGQGGGSSPCGQAQSVLANALGPAGG